MISAADVWSYSTRTLTSPVFGDLVTKNLAHVLSDSTAFKGAFIDASISSRSSHSATDVWAVGSRTLTSPTFGDLATKNITDILSDSVAFAGADIATIKADTTAILVDTASIISGISSILVDTTNILVDTSTLLTRLSATRAGYLDNLSGGAVALASICTEVRLAHLDADISSRSSHSAADVWAVVSRTLTSPVFGDLVTKNLTAILSDSTAFKGANVATILSEIQNATYGLNALYVNQGIIIAYVDELESRLTATRAGYLDNLSGGAVALASVCTEVRLAELGATNIPADIDTLLTRVPAEVTQRAKSSFKVVEKFFADSVRLTVTSTAGSVTIKSNFAISFIPSGVTLDYVHILVFSQATENTNASANKVNGAQNIQIQKHTGGSWTNAVAILDDALRVPASTRDMGRLLGAPVDCKSQVTGNNSYDLQWTSAQMDLDSLYLDDVFFLIEVGFH